MPSTLSVLGKSQFIVTIRVKDSPQITPIYASPPAFKDRGWQPELPSFSLDLEEAHRLRTRKI